MQDSVTKHSSLPANYVSINDLREQWLKKQRPKDEAVVEEEKKCLEYEAKDEDEEEEFPRKYVTINDLREKWLKKQQKKEKEKDGEMRKGGNDELGFGVNSNLIEDDGDGNRGLIVDDSTVKKAGINGKIMTGSMRKKLWIERRGIWAQKQTGIVEEKGVVEIERKGKSRIQRHNKKPQKRTGIVVVENEAEMKQDVGKFRKKKRFPGTWSVVQEVEDKEKPFPVTGTRNTGLEKHAQEVEEKPNKRFSVLEKPAEVDVDVEEKGEWFPTTETQNTVKEKRVQEVEEKLKRSETETGKKNRFPVTRTWNTVQQEKRGHEEDDKEKPFPVTGTRNTGLEKHAQEVDVGVGVEEKGEWFPTTETRNAVKEKCVQEVEEKLKRSETGKKKRFPVRGTWNAVQQEKQKEDEKEKLIREMEEKMKEVSILEKRYQEVEQEMKEKRNELSLLEKRFHDIEKMEETQASETDHNVSNNAEHGTRDRRWMGYRSERGWGRGRGGGRSGNGHHSERGGVVWVKKDEGLHKTN